MLCVVSTERCVTQVPELGYDDRIGVGACDRGPSGWGRRELGATEKAVALFAFNDAKALVCDLGPIPLRPQLGTQCDTSATSLRKQNSKLPFKRPQIRG